MALKPNNPLVKVLLVDDDEDDYLIIRDMLSKIIRPKLNLQWVASFAEAAKLIAAAKHDIYLIDYHLGAQTGLDLLSNFDLSRREQPFIILTGAGDETIEHRAMEQGVADYLVKGKFNAELLARSLRYGLQRKQAETRRLQQLIELNKTKDEFIAVASHQLRTPATAVKQYVGMLLSGYAGKISRDQRQMLNNAYASNERQIKIINSLLKAAQANAGNITLRKTSFNLAQLIAEVVRDQGDALSTKNQQVTITTKPQNFQKLIKADRPNMRMVVDNLLDNSIKYSPENQVISINLWVSGKTLTFTISNNGPSISKADQAKLFEKFSRLDGAVATSGTGLGLYWAKYLVNLHGGNIGVASSPGKGASFRFSLPL
ncbi:MAG: ATP-binding response regulator [Candidatus Saccharimonadales bacterium]